MINARCVPPFRRNCRYNFLLIYNLRSVQLLLGILYCSGISSGGIAEIFETNAVEGSETIILKSRRGIAKMALEHGAPIIPGYFFGNSKVFNVWYDKYGFMQWLSRKLRISLVFFSGRIGLPIPFRTPLLAVFAPPFTVKKKKNPTAEDIDAVMEKLESEIMTLFEKHKHAFGWSKMKLIIK